MKTSKNSRMMPRLSIDIDTGKVVGHDGRHRMRALEMAGATRTPIEIVFYKDGSVYKGNDNGERLEMIDIKRLTSQFDLQYGNAIAYSTKRDSSISEDASNYIASTEEFQEAISILGERFELAGKVTLSPKAIDRLSGRLLEKSKSNYSREQLTERLTALFDYIANSRDVSWEEITTIAANISKDMLKVIVDLRYLLCYNNYSSPTQRFSE